MARYLETYAIPPPDPDMTWDRNSQELQIVAKELQRYYIQLTNKLENTTVVLDSRYYAFLYHSARMYMRMKYRYGGLELLPDVLREIFNDDEYMITIISL